MSTRLLSTALSTALAATLALSLSGAAAFAQSYTPPAGIPTAAAVGASASPLVGQGYLPSRQDGSQRVDQGFSGHRR